MFFTGATQRLRAVTFLLYCLYSFLNLRWKSHFEISKTDRELVEILNSFYMAESVKLHEANLFYLSIFNAYSNILSHDFEKTFL